MKQGRNELCNCGSGKKYKKCCMNAHREENEHKVKDVQDSALKTIIEDIESNIINYAIKGSGENLTKLAIDLLISKKIHLNYDIAGFWQHEDQSEFIAEYCEDVFSDKEIMFIQDLNMGEPDEDWVMVNVDNVDNFLEYPYQDVRRCIDVDIDTFRNSVMIKMPDCKL